MLNHMPSVPAWQRGPRASVLACQHACVLLWLTCQRANKRANVAYGVLRRAKDIPNFQIFLLRNATGSFYTNNYTWYYSNTYHINMMFLNKFLFAFLSNLQAQILNSKKQKFFTRNNQKTKQTNKQTKVSTKITYI